MRIGLIGLAAVLCAAARLQAAGDDKAWQALDAAATELRAQEAELRVCNAALDACREGVAAKRSAELAALKKAVDDAEKAVTAAHTESGLDAARDKLQKARTARDEKVEALLAKAEAYQAAKTRQDELKKKIGALEKRIEALNEGELLELARLRIEDQQLGKQISGALRAWWRRGEVEGEFKAADEAYKSFGALSGKAAGMQQPNEKAKAARKALADAVAALPVDGPAAVALQKRCAEIGAKVAESKAKIAELEKSLIGPGRTVSVTVKAFDRKTKKEEDKRVSLWLPSGHEYIRGVVIAHPMISGLASAQPMRMAAAREGLGLMVYDDFSGDGKGSLAKLDAMFEKFAAESKQPELKGAPVLLGGLSASVLGTRNVACAVPERVFGIVHAAGGNMQEMPDDGRGMVQVPFLALNGEFEWCGPIGGIRPEYGNQTQWVMIREQMLRLWRDKHEHRMTLVVVPNADHGAWDVGLTALFVRKAAQYRLPKEKRDGSTPAVCTPLPVNKGWLTDADLDHPKFEPAPYDSFKGDKNNAFWHFDEEMAMAVYKYHQNRFVLPDPTKTSPIPADWPPKK